MPLNLFELQEQFTIETFSDNFDKIKKKKTGSKCAGISEN